MLDVAEGKPLPFTQEEIRPNRWALEVRLNAEDPRTFNPSFGTITRLQVPAWARTCASPPGVYEGADVPPYYDSLLHAADHRRAPTAPTPSGSWTAASAANLRVEGVKTLAAAAALDHPPPRVRRRRLLDAASSRSTCAELVSDLPRAERRGRGAQGRALRRRDLGPRPAGVDVGDDGAAGTSQPFGRPGDDLRPARHDRRARSSAVRACRASASPRSGMRDAGQSDFKNRLRIHDLATLAPHYNAHGALLAPSATAAPAGTSGS